MRRSAAVHGAALVILAVATVALIAGFSLRSGRSKHFSVDSSVAQTVDFATSANTAGISSMIIVVEHTNTRAADREANDPTAEPFKYPQVTAVDPHWDTAVAVCERVYRTLPGASRELCCTPTQRSYTRTACSDVFKLATSTDIPSICGAAAGGVCSGVSDDVVATYDIVYSAVDRSGNKALDATVTLNYVDSTAPVVTVPSTSTSTACGAGAASTPTSLVAYDAVDGVLAATVKMALRYDPATWHTLAASLGAVSTCPAGGIPLPSPGGRRRRLGRRWYPTRYPTKYPTKLPTKLPTNWMRWTRYPTKYPTKLPTVMPTKFPTKATKARTTRRATRHPTKNPTNKEPTKFPTNTPTKSPTVHVDGKLVWHGWAPRVKLGVCEGDCDRDADCTGSLTCFQRSGYTRVPGCSTAQGTNEGQRSGDYCVEAPTRAPTSFPTSSMVAAQIVCTTYCVADASGNEGCASVVSGTCAATQIETGSFRGSTAIDHRDTAVVFSTSFANDGVTFFANAIGSRGGHAATARAYGVTSSGVASVRIDEASCMDEWHLTEQLDWMALQPGRHASLEVGEALVSSKAGVVVTFTAPIPNAVITLTIQGDVQDCDFKVLRLKSVTSAGFTLFAQQEEKNIKTGVAFGPALTVGWLAMSATGTGAPLKLSSGGVDRVFRAQIVQSTKGKNVRTTVATAADQRNPMIFASLGFNGRDPAGIRVAHGANSFQLYIEEETCNDNDLHIVEDVHIITVDRREMGAEKRGSKGVCYRKTN